MGIVKKRIAVCITGASGAEYTYRFLKEASKLKNIETHLVISKAGAIIIKEELGLEKKDVEKLATFSYDENNIMAPIASGSFRLNGVLIAPCSMKTLSGIATGYENNLIIRVASVALKERWKLVVMPRETPLSAIHLRNILTIAEAGAIVMPPMPEFYLETKDINKLIGLTVGRILTMFGIENDLHVEWGKK